jgi:hypothetical protein
MSRRFVCLLLVPLLLANQGLSLAHSHLGTEVATPEGHSSRPHIHFGGHDHHAAAHGDDHVAGHLHKHSSDSEHRTNKHHEAVATAIETAGDHNADALYFAQTVTLARDCDASSILLAKHNVVATTHQTADSGDWRLRLRPLRYSASEFDADCPIYLRTHSLRI